MKTAITAIAIAITTAATAVSAEGAYLGGMAYQLDGFAIEDDIEFSAFAGYRVDMNGVMVGAEAGTDGDFYTVEGQVGYSVVEDVVVYGFVGGIELFEEKGYSYGVGADYVTEEGLLIGARYMEADFDGTKVDQIGVRVGLAF